MLPDNGTGRRVIAKGGAHMRPKLTEELIDQMTELKADSLTNRDICRMVGINEATPYRSLNKPSGKLHRALSETLKKAGSGYKRTLLTTIREAATCKNGQRRRRCGCWSASTPTSTRRRRTNAARGPRPRRRSCSECLSGLPRPRMTARAVRRTAERMVSAAGLCIPPTTFSAT